MPDNFNILDKGQGTGVPSAGSTKTLTAADNGQVLVNASSQTYTVPAGMSPGFGAMFRGTTVFSAGGGVTLNDARTVSGAATLWCALIQTATDTYDIVGIKA